MENSNYADNYYQSDITEQDVYIGDLTQVSEENENYDYYNFYPDACI